MTGPSGCDAANGSVFIADWSTAAAPPTGGAYTELLSAAALSVGRFTAPVGHEDTQSPHAEDEVYFVAAGEADLIVGAEHHAVRTGSITYVPAGMPHRFTNVRKAIEVLVFFAPTPLQS
jgi:mannose-6-phosphate isomerase-like protein (cupin superfamily)